MSETGSQVSWDEFSDSRCVSPALSCDFDINDTSWVDTSMSPGSEATSPEPPTSSSIWARFGSGLSRFTLDLGKNVSAPSAGIPSIQVSSNNPAIRAVVPPRDDVIEGAEGEAKSEPSESSSWSLPQSFRKFSLNLTQSVILKSQSSDTADSDWLSNKLVVRSHSSNMLSEGCGVSSAEEHVSRDESRGTSPADAEAVSVSTSPRGSMTCVLNHSHTGPFTPVSVDSKLFDVWPTVSAVSTSSAVATSSAMSTSSAVPALSLASPTRLASKPPLPQRSGTMSPRDAPSRPRLTHRRSQSLQQFTPAGSFTLATTERSSEPRAVDTVAENDPTLSELTSDVTSNTREIFV